MSLRAPAPDRNPAQAVTTACDDAPSGTAGPAGSPDAGTTPRQPALDGWRAISILAVLAAHLLPLGPARWQLNVGAGLFGMALFFILSGYLITSALLRGQGLRRFLLLRATRVLPLAWLCIVVGLAWQGAPASTWWRHLLFVANLPPQDLWPATAHLWSLCVELQFYVGVALLVLLGGRRALWLLPLLGLASTFARIVLDQPFQSTTHTRADEVLAGATLALWLQRAPLAEVSAAAAGLPGVVRTPVASRPLRLAVAALGHVNPLCWLALLLVCCLPALEAATHARAWVAMLLIGSTLVQARHPLSRALERPLLAHVARLSYALYLVHPLLAHGWLGSGSTLERYLKRPLLLIVAWLLAEASHRGLERPMMRWARRRSAAWTAHPAATRAAG
ncbi:MAG: hypothetical protein RIQ53_2666 [Pseudomonadota bacterium]